MDMAKGGDMDSTAEMIEVVCPRCGEDELPKQKQTLNGLYLIANLA